MFITKIIARVFPRRTKATPDDPLAFTGPPPGEGLPDIDEVHISVAFTYDVDKAHNLVGAFRRKAAYRYGTQLDSQLMYRPA